MKVSSSSLLLWFRLDLRLTDNPALHAAIESHKKVIPIFIWAPEEEAPWQPGAASRSWLHHSLESLDKSLRILGSQLIIRKGKSLEILKDLLQETQASSVYWNRRYEPALIARDKKIKEELQNSGIETKSFNSALLFEPWEIETQQKKPFQVFTPFSKVCFAKEILQQLFQAPKQLETPDFFPASLKIEDLDLKPQIAWDENFYTLWQPGEKGAEIKLKAFEKKIEEYKTARDIPSQNGTSLLSPHLHFGEIGPRQVWQRIRQYPSSEATYTYLKEILWREFAHHLLYHFPHTTEEPLRIQFKNFPWEKNSKTLKAWQQGKTGFPLVDAGMRELWKTGIMHNRVRMLVASFLVKDLFIHWKEGAKWFWDTLVDADLASNTLGWQWTAGCGADAAPFFRIFSPQGQFEKFDSEKKYVQKWIKELGTSQYPQPIVNHSEMRLKALDIFKSLKSYK